MAIEAVLALAADDLRVPLEELDPGGARDVLLVRDDERHQVLVKLAEPEAVVDQVGIGLADQRLEPERFLGEGEELDLAMGLVEHDGGRGLVDLARLDPDEAVLDVVDPADAVLAGDLVELLDQLDAVELAAAERDGPAAVEA